MSNEKEFKLVVTHEGRRKVFRQWGYHVADAKAQLKSEIGPFSTISVVELKS